MNAKTRSNAEPAHKRGQVLRRSKTGAKENNAFGKRTSQKRKLPLQAEGTNKRKVMGELGEGVNVPITRSMAAAMRKQHITAGIAIDDIAPHGTRMSVDKAPVRHIEDIDANDRHDPQQALEYLPRIFHMLKQKEDMVDCVPNAKYMEEVQSDINPKMRGILVDWMISVGMRFRMHSETLFIAVDLIDRFLSIKDVSRGKLQLVGVTALLVASKIEESWSPLIADFEYISDHACSRSEILDMEKLILTSLDFNMYTPNPLHFLRRYSKASGYDLPTHTLAKYLTELSMPDYFMLQFKPSLIAATAVYLARRMNTTMEPWTETLEAHTGYSEGDMLSCGEEFNRIIDLPGTEKSVYRWVKAKYSDDVFYSVSKIKSKPFY